MKNEITTNVSLHTDFDFKNPVIAATLILTVGICYCVTVNAKYNRDTELTYREFSLKSFSSPVVAAVPV